MSEAKVKDVEDLPGVGPAIADKLREAGYDTLEAIGTQAPGTFQTLRVLEKNPVQNLYKKQERLPTLVLSLLERN